MAKEPELTTRLRNDTDYTSSNDPIVSFLYLLMRDHLPLGVVAKILSDSCINEECVFTNGYLAEYAKWAAKQLRGNNNASQD